MRAKEKKEFKKACDLVERTMRDIGPKCEVILLKHGDGVQVADLSWSGCVVEPTLYKALTTALKEKDS